MAQARDSPVMPPASRRRSSRCWRASARGLRTRGPRHRSPGRARRRPSQSRPRAPRPLAPRTFDDRVAGESPDRHRHPEGRRRERRETERRITIWWRSTPARSLTAPSTNSPLKAMTPAVKSRGYLSILGGAGAGSPAVEGFSVVVGTLAEKGARGAQIDDRQDDSGAGEEAQRIDPEAKCRCCGRRPEQNADAAHRVQWRRNRPAVPALDGRALVVRGGVRSPSGDAERGQTERQRRGHPTSDPDNERHRAQADGPPQHERARASRPAEG